MTSSIARRGSFALAAACFLVGAGPSRAADIHWVRIQGGTFVMGSASGSPKTGPLHRVKVRAFDISKTEVTVEQYAACVRQGRCSAPGTSGKCNYGAPGRDRHPVNCVTWDDAVRFARFAGARLPSEAEWEYAATGGGRPVKYPWGSERPSCRRAVMQGADAVTGCGTKKTWPACSKAAGNTAQGLCDMSGNVWEWVQDEFHPSYAGAPTDASAWESRTARLRVSRGGSYVNASDKRLRVNARSHEPAGRALSILGFRIARDAR